MRETAPRVGAVPGPPTSPALEDRLLGSLLGWSLAEACARRLDVGHLPTPGEVEVVLVDVAPLVPADSTAAAVTRARELLHGSATSPDAEPVGVMVPADAVANAIAAGGAPELLDQVRSSVRSRRAWPGGSLRFLELSICVLAAGSELDTDVATPILSAAGSLPPGPLRETVEVAAMSGSVQQLPRSLAREIVVDDPTSTVAYGVIAFLGGADSFERTLGHAVRLPAIEPGAAAVAGALVGATVGARGLPAGALGRLSGYGALVDLGRRLLALQRGTSA